jgi:hypothetical protein
MSLTILICVMFASRDCETRFKMKMSSEWNHAGYNNISDNAKQKLIWFSRHLREYVYSLKKKIIYFLTIVLYVSSLTE